MDMQYDYFLSKVKTKMSSFQKSYSDSWIIHSPTLALNDTHLNSYSVSSDH